MSRFIGNLKIYDLARLMVCTSDELDFIEKNLRVFQNSYCADIAPDKGNSLALIVRRCRKRPDRIPHSVL